MAFEKKVPVWNAEGVEPPDTLKNEGFQAGYKPPASYFNWFWHAVSACLAELQAHGLTLEEALNGSGGDFLPLSGGTVTGTLVLSKVGEAEGDTYSEPPLVVGGDPSTYHLEFDNNEIQSKLNETTPGNLFLNSHGGRVSVGEGGLTVNGSLDPAEPLTSNMGTADLPWNRFIARYVELYGGANALYGRFRVSTTGSANTNGVVTLELGNATASGSSHNASGKITMYGSGTGFTNIMPNANASGSNTVTLPTASGTMAVFEASTSDITAGSTTLATGKLYLVYE